MFRRDSTENVLIVIPAVDVRDGACAQLAAGDYVRQRLHADDPAGVARWWAQAGFDRLHLLDFDAAQGKADNASVVRDVLGARAAETQVGGGIRTTRRVDELLSDGACRVVVGGYALEEPDWLAEIANAYPGEVIVAADVRDRRVVTRGWSRQPPRDIIDLVEELNDLPLSGVMVTDVLRQGRLRGTDLPLMEDVAFASDFPVLASGGITTMHDLRALEDRGVAIAVVGMALYTGALDARLVAEDFSSL